MNKWTPPNHLPSGGTLFIRFIWYGTTYDLQLVVPVSPDPRLSRTIIDVNPSLGTTSMRPATPRCRPARSVRRGNRQHPNTASGEARQIGSEVFSVFYPHVQWCTVYSIDCIDVYGLYESHERTAHIYRVQVWILNMSPRLPPSASFL